jgi:hypothetical protein
LHRGRFQCLAAAFMTNAVPEKSSFPFETLSNVRPLRPIRVLLAGRAVRYLRAVAFLFERHGCEIYLSLRPAALLDDVDTFQPEVVVLVEGDSFAEAVAQATALLAQSDRLNVVLSTSRSDVPDTSELRFVPKGGSFAELALAVERAWIELPARFSFRV